METGASTVTGGRRSENAVSEPTGTTRRVSPSLSQWRNARSIPRHLAFLHDLVKDRRRRCMRSGLFKGVRPSSVNRTRLTKADMGEWEDARLRRDTVVPVQATGLRVSDDLPSPGQAGPPGEGNLLRWDGAESAPPGLLAAGHFIGAQHPAAEGELHRPAQQIGELVARIEALYSLVGPSLVEKRVGRDSVDDLQWQVRLEMVLQDHESGKTPGSLGGTGRLAGARCSSFVGRGHV